MARIRCKHCGKEHEEIDTQIGFGKPDAYFKVPETERDQRTIVNSDICDIDRSRFFARGVLQIPVHEHEHFGWGIWVEMRAADFDRYMSLYESPDQANEPPLRGHIATSIPAYREDSLGIPVSVQLTGPTTRPILFVNEGVDHPIADEQRNGISMDRLNDYFSSIRRQSSVRSEAHESGTVRCTTHGMQQETFVCQHIVQGMASRKRVGFFWTGDDPDNARPDAWCYECEERVRATGGEWVGEAESHLGAKVLCGACYDLAKKFHMGEEAES
jgi:hypothetical protein